MINNLNKYKYLHAQSNLDDTLVLHSTILTELYVYRILHRNIGHITIKLCHNNFKQGAYTEMCALCTTKVQNYCIT
jgi:hypothetical protein